LPTPYLMPSATASLAAVAVPAVISTSAANGKSPEKELCAETAADGGSISYYTSFPHFTADGKSIDFEHYVNGQIQIWKMNAADGSDQTALIDTPWAGAPFPTADGKYLMFWMNNAIYRANSDGSGAELVIQAPASNDGANGLLEAISPDGKRIMYLTYDPTNKRALAGLRDLNTLQGKTAGPELSLADQAVLDQAMRSYAARQYNQARDDLLPLLADPNKKSKDVLKLDNDLKTLGY